MIKIKNISDYEKMANSQELPKIVLGNVYSDILVMENQLDKDYYNEKQVDLYGPLVLIMSGEEFENIEKLVPSIDVNMYEYKEIVGINHNHYVSKLCYLFNNGESGICVYVIRKFKERKRFKDNVYITSHAANVLPEELVIYLHTIVEDCRSKLNNELDYLQVFEIKNVMTSAGKNLSINHRQEYPLYRNIYYLSDIKCDDCKVFWISSFDNEIGEYSTIMMAEDY